jgi:hypothetical protein
MFKQVRICQTFLRQQPQVQRQIKSIMAPIACAPFSRAQEFLDKSRTRYQEHVKSFRERVDKAERDYKPAAQRPFPKGYSHPFNSEHHPLNFSPVKTAELFHDFIGPEQVSPHYENFLMSRKYAMIFWAGLLFLSFGVGSLDLHWIAKSAFFPWIFWFQLMYFFLEWRKSLFKPLLARFYRRIAANECYNFEVFYHENIELKMREMIMMTKHQLEFWEMHREFLNVKAESINNFMANEYTNLQKHISERATNILTQAKSFEEMNRNKILSGIVEGANAELDRALAGPQAEEIKRAMFNSALEGLSKGYMEYNNDPVLPLIQRYVKSEMERYTSLSEEEQSKLISLSEAQIQSLRDSDRKAKQDYLEGEPKGLDSSLKAHEHVKKVLASWGK